MSTPARGVVPALPPSTVPPTRSAATMYKSGTGLASGITSAAPGIILVIAALSLIHCQTFGGNDNERHGLQRELLLEV